MVEAFKHGFAIRMSMSDPALNTNVTKAAVTELIKGLYMKGLRRNTSGTDVYLYRSMDGESGLKSNHQTTRLQPRINVFSAYD